MRFSLLVILRYSREVRTKFCVKTHSWYAKPFYNGTHGFGDELLGIRVDDFSQGKRSFGIALTFRGKITWNESKAIFSMVHGTQ